MLKKKLYSLVVQKNMATGEKFEIIHDSDAINITGGGSCGMLQTCGTFKGDCPNLTSCGTYTAPDE